jgi:hypothetical protein
MIAGSRPLSRIVAHEAEALAGGARIVRKELGQD